MGDTPKSVAEFARQHQISTQAVYKKLAKRGISPESLRNSTGGCLSEEGLSILRDLVSSAEERKPADSTNRKPVDDNQQPEVDNGHQQEVDRLRRELRKTQHDLKDAQHRAELAEVKAAAANDERDFLRQQLDNAIKATALASAKRLSAPEEPQQESHKAEAPQHDHKSLRKRLVGAWKVLLDR